MRVLARTNRNIDNGAPSLFGERFNAEGPCELTFARANKAENNWKVDLVLESSHNDDSPGRGALKEYSEWLKQKEKACVFFIHGVQHEFRGES